MKKKEKLLEWVTAEAGERQAKTDLKSYIKEMLINLIFGAIFLFVNNLAIRLIGILWIIGPFIAWYISLERSKEEEISEIDKGYLKEIARKTWNFFESYITAENHYLMRDN